jgi:hypothetical protein
MNTERLVNAIRSLGADPVGIGDLRTWNDVTSHPDVHEYLESCVTRGGFIASGLGILGISRLLEENTKGVSPGGQIREYGYVAIAISPGGNAVVLCSKDGKVYWADHSFFSDPIEIAYEDRETGEWHYVPWSPKSVRTALVHLSDSVEEFLLDLFRGRLAEFLDRLD